MNLVFEESGAINVQPAVVAVRLEHLLKKTLRRLFLITFSAKNQKFSGIAKKLSKKLILNGLKKKLSPYSFIFIFLRARQNK